MTFLNSCVLLSDRGNTGHSHMREYIFIHVSMRCMYQQTRAMSSYVVHVGLLLQSQTDLCGHHWLESPCSPRSVAVHPPLPRLTLATEGLADPSLHTTGTCSFPLIRPIKGRAAHPTQPPIGGVCSRVSNIK